MYRFGYEEKEKYLEERKAGGVIHLCEYVESHLASSKIVAEFVRKEEDIGTLREYATLINKNDMREVHDKCGTYFGQIYYRQFTNEDSTGFTDKFIDYTSMEFIFERKKLERIGDKLYDTRDELLWYESRRDTSFMLTLRDLEDYDDDLIIEEFGRDFYDEYISLKNKITDKTEDTVEDTPTDIEEDNEMSFYKNGSVFIFIDDTAVVSTTLWYVLTDRSDYAGVPCAIRLSSDDLFVENKYERRISFKKFKQYEIDDLEKSKDCIFIDKLYNMNLSDIISSYGLGFVKDIICNANIYCYNDNWKDKQKDNPDVIL